MAAPGRVATTHRPFGETASSCGPSGTGIISGDCADPASSTETDDES